MSRILGLNICYIFFNGDVNHCLCFGVNTKSRCDIWLLKIVLTACKNAVIKSSEKTCFCVSFWRCQFHMPPLSTRHDWGVLKEMQLWMYFLLVSLIFSLSLLTLGINAKNLVCTLCVSAHAYYACLWCLLIPSDISYPCHTFAFKSAVYISCKKNSWRHKHRRNSAALLSYFCKPVLQDNWEYTIV